MKYILDTDEHNFTGPYNTIAATEFPSMSISLSDYLDQVSAMGILKTGILPLNGTGVLAINRGCGLEQIIYQIAPTKALVKWGKTEGDPFAPILELAFPYRILLIDYCNNVFTGIRHFYSVDPITSYDQQLYIPNLANTNTMGYRNTSLGWVCIYPHDHDTPTLQSRIEYALSRYNPMAEPYNDDNMSSTDGPRLYKSMLMPVYMYDKHKWAEHTSKEGTDFMLDPTNLVPAVYDPLRAENQHTIEVVSTTRSGVPFTLRHAAMTPYAAYYVDHFKKRPWMYSEDEELPSHYINSLMYGNSDLPSKQVVKDLSWAIETLQKPSSTTFSEEVSKYLLDGVDCSICLDRFSVQENMRNLILGVKRPEPSDDILFDYGQACNNCFDDNAIYVDGLDEYVVPDITFYEELDDIYHLLVDGTDCPQCGSIHLTDENDYWIFAVDGKARVGCIVCLRQQDYCMPINSDKQFLTADCKQVSVYNLVKDPETNLMEYKKVIECLAPGSQEQTCACGFLFNSCEALLQKTMPNTNICYGCTNSLGEYKPLFSTTS